MGRLNHKRGRPSNYRKSLQKNPYWEKVKRKVRIRDNFQCVCCGSKIRLETHHIKYAGIVGKELEHLDWMVTLCENHHQEAHNNISHPFNPNNKFKKSVPHYGSTPVQRNNSKD
jgi:5-methylcytosine-specific restriction endonuclease McrA